MSSPKLPDDVSAARALNEFARVLGSHSAFAAPVTESKAQEIRRRVIIAAGMLGRGENTLDVADELAQCAMDLRGE